MIGSGLARSPSNDDTDDLLQSSSSMDLTFRKLIAGTGADDDEDDADLFPPPSSSTFFPTAVPSTLQPPQFPMTNALSSHGTPLFSYTQPAEDFGRRRTKSLNNPPPYRPHFDALPQEVHMQPFFLPASQLCNTPPGTITAVISGQQVVPVVPVYTTGSPGNATPGAYDPFEPATQIFPQPIGYIPQYAAHTDLGALGFQQPQFTGESIFSQNDPPQPERRSSLDTARVVNAPSFVPKNIRLGVSSLAHPKTRVEDISSESSHSPTPPSDIHSSPRAHHTNSPGNSTRPRSNSNAQYNRVRKSGRKHSDSSKFPYAGSSALPPAVGPSPLAKEAVISKAEPKNPLIKAIMLQFEAIAVEVMKGTTSGSSSPNPAFGKPATELHLSDFCEFPDDLATPGFGTPTGDKGGQSVRQKAKLVLKKLRASGEGKFTLNDIIDMFSQMDSLGGNERQLYFLELADLAKRDGDVERARKLYRTAIYFRPKRGQCWMEFAKMEEELNELERSLDILLDGKKHCPYTEPLIIKAIKIQERLGRLDDVHTMIKQLKDQPLEKIWRPLLEGALVDARNGNAESARETFTVLMKNVPWFGPIFLEAYRFEMRGENTKAAEEVVKKGLEANPKYGPLWFCKIRLCEKYHPDDLPGIVVQAEKALLKDLKWKVFFEQAQIMDRAHRLEDSRKAYGTAMTFCPQNLRWKVFFGHARTELLAGNVDTARSLIKQSLDCTPPKMKPCVYLEQARIEEFAGCVDKAREILDNAKQVSAHEWKVFLERVLLEIRARNRAGALEQIHLALQAHPGTGRLWAILIQLKDVEGLDKQMEAYLEAKERVPKSGEVWCEGARIFMAQGKFAEARKCLENGAKFTPQYGDSFVEYLRVDYLENGRFSERFNLELQCLNAEPNYGPLWLYCKASPLDSPKQVLRNAKTLLQRVLSDPSPLNIERSRLENVNNIYASADDLDAKQRQKLIFGSDVIKL